jgi:3-oxoacyl-[acyl-carrier protein] reductase
MRFKDKVVLITGGGRGIGAETARIFGKEGAIVIINYVADKAAAESVLDEIDGNGIAVEADISREEDVNRLFDTVASRYGRLDILVNNAGIVSPKPFHELTLEQWRHTFAVNLDGTFMCTKRAKSLMKEGSIVNVSSIRGLFEQGRPPIIDYSASKAAVISFTKTLAKELAPSIRVNAVAPGMTNTDIAKQLPEESVEQFKRQIYLKRLIEPKEVANAIVFLCSKEASGITGALLMVDGGQCLS